MRNYYRDDPRWIQSKFAGTCSRCATAIPHQASAFWYPKGRKLLCETCGGNASREFEAMAADEYQYSDA